MEKAPPARPSAFEFREDSGDSREEKAKSLKTLVLSPDFGENPSLSGRI
jgi:hypothetical protein